MERQSDCPGDRESKLVGASGGKPHCKEILKSQRRPYFRVPFSAPQIVGVDFLVLF
ncbi:MAG: hypothetical protein WDN46_00205 [Methylocella sp.]